MARKNKMLKPSKTPARTARGGEGEFPDEPISSLGWRVIAGGALLVVAGFAVLTRADALGRNWASTASPLMILAGYSLVGVGIFVPGAPQGGGEPPSSPPPAQP